NLSICIHSYFNLGTPTSTLFPYTTLFRSCGACSRKACPPCSRAWCATGAWCRPACARRRRRWTTCAATTTADRCSTTGANRPPRSEEHTSELQSRENLVCRLLLEKKKKQN